MNQNTLRISDEIIDVIKDEDISDVMLAFSVALDWVAKSQEPGNDKTRFITEAANGMLSGYIKHFKE